MKHGFTLIEIIIVISIIMVLATLSLGSYTKSQRNISLDLDTDRFVQLLFTYREMSQRSSRCHSVLLARGKIPQHQESAYLAKKKICDAAASKIPLAWPKELVLTEISLDDQPAVALEITFVPPNGEVQFQRGAEKREKATLVLSGRTIMIDRISGTVRK